MKMRAAFSLEEPQRDKSSGKVKRAII